MIVLIILAPVSRGLLYCSGLSFIRKVAKTFFTAKFLFQKIWYNNGLILVSFSITEHGGEVMTRIPNLTVLLLIISCFFSISFIQTEDSLPTDVKKKIIKIGEEASAKLMKTLKGHLTEALAENDLVTAFEVCATIAYSLTEEIQDSLPQGIKLKRTSFKYRNPKNKPDPEEEKILRYFEKELAKKGSLPNYYIQDVKAQGEFRYYKPMTAGKLCLKCHGEIELLDREVVLSLRENYPDDRAIGYVLGDFRGVVCVAVPAENLKKKSR
jgi:hypothetical protein